MMKEFSATLLLDINPLHAVKLDENICPEFQQTDSSWFEQTK